MQTYKVGELSRRTGVTVRTLHHYDEIGLLSPSLRTGSDHRLYTAADLARLQQILSLRQLGFTLDEVRDCLSRPDFSPLDVLRRHVERLRDQIELQRRLCDQLEGLAAYFQRAEEVSADMFLQTIEVMNMIENYYTPEQLETLRRRREEAMANGVDIAQQGAADWTQLFAELKTEMEKGTDPADPRVQALHQRSQALIQAFTGGDPGIERGLNRLWTEQGDKLSAQRGYDPALMAYFGKAAEAAKAAGQS